MSTQNKPWTKKALEAGKDSIGALRARMDSWVNALSGLGTDRDKSTWTLPAFTALLNEQVLESLYHNDDIAARIVSALPDECFKKGMFPKHSKAAEDDDNTKERIVEIQKRANELGGIKKMHEAFIWGRLYGQGAILLGAIDPRLNENGEYVVDVGMPLEMEKVEELRYLTVVDKRDLTPWSYYDDPTAPKFGEVATYMLQPVGVFMGVGYDPTAYSGQPLYVHESRLIQFGGELTSRRKKLENRSTDMSVLQKCFRALQLTNNNWQSASALLADANQGVFSIKNLVEMISQDPETMQTRFALVDQMRSVFRSILIDADGEKFERVSTSFSGIPEMLFSTWQRLASAARMPLTLLMGMSPGGLNATGESDMQWWYDTVGSTQMLELAPQGTRLYQLIAKSLGYEDWKEWEASFQPPYQMSEKEIAEMHATQATADEKYWTMGALSADEIAVNRFGGKYSLETKIDIAARRAIMNGKVQETDDDEESEDEEAEEEAETESVDS